jgi:hypothetical protein
MTVIDPIRPFLEQPRVAYVSTIDLEGYPHTVPVWFMVEGDELIFSAQKSRARLKHIQANAKGAVAIGGNIGDSEGYLLKGTFRMEAQPNPALRRRIIDRYMPREAAEQFIASVSAETVIVRFTPTKVMKVH